MFDFLQRLLGRIITRVSLPKENGWDVVLGSDSTNAQLLLKSQFMENTEVRLEAMGDAKCGTNV